jgi:TonB family protein
MPAAIPTETAPQDVVHHTLARLHTWIDEVPPPKRRLGKFIVVAAALHFAAFFFILIDNTRPELTHQSRTSVIFDDAATHAAGSPDNAYWDGLTDPRLYVLPESEGSQPSQMALPLDPGPLQLQSVPLPSPAEVGSFPLLNQPLPTLTERVKEALRPSRVPFAYQENPAPLVHATAWQWGDALASRAPAAAPTLPSPVSDTEINPTRLRVAVAPDGTVSDVLLDESSKDPGLDQQATLAALKLRFQPTDAPGTAWGMVTVAWYYTPKPKEIAPPSAPLAP